MKRKGTPDLAQTGMRRRIRFVLSRVAASAMIAVALAICLPAAASALPPDDLHAAQVTSARFPSPTQAQAHGYYPYGGAAAPCVASPAGAMGIHYENAALIASPAVLPTQPEMLIYLPNANGQLEFVALEYFKTDADQDPATTGDRPSLFGRAFDGPFPGHHPGMGLHYDLHVWVGEQNPSGLFAPFNPALSCTP